MIVKDILAEPADADAMVALIGTSAPSSKTYIRWLDRILCCRPESIELWQAWINSTAGSTQRAGPMLTAYIRLLLAPSESNLSAMLSILEDRTIRRASSVLSEIMPTRLRKRREDRVTLASLLPTALAYRGTAVRAHLLVECDGQSPAQAIDTVILIGARLPPPARKRVSSGLALNLLNRWQSTATAGPMVVVGEPGTGSEAIARLAAGRLGRPFRHLDFPDIFKRSAALSLFRESVDDLAVFYSESPPTPLVRFILDGFGSRFVLICRSSRAVGHGPGVELPADITDAVPDAWGACGDDAALLTWEFPITTWRRDWLSMVHQTKTANALVLDPSRCSADDTAESVRHFLADHPDRLPSPPDPGPATESTPVQPRLEPRSPLETACLAYRDWMQDPAPARTPHVPPSPAPAPRHPSPISYLRRLLADGHTEQALAAARTLSPRPLNRLVSALSVGTPGNAVHQALMRDVLPDRPPAPKIFLSGPPRSQAVYFARAAAKAIGWTMDNLAREAVTGVDGYATVHLDYLIERYDTPMVIWSHSPPTPFLVTLLATLQIPAHISIGIVWDDLIREFTTWADRNQSHADLLPGTDLSLSDRAWHVFLRGFAPYVRFFVGWKLAFSNGILPGSLTSIQEALKNETRYLRLLLDHHESVPQNTDLQQALRVAASNPGTTRHRRHPRLGPPLPDMIGYDVFPEVFRSYAQEFYRRFPGIDFSPIDPLGSPILHA